MSKEAVLLVDKEAAILCQSITWLDKGCEEEGVTAAMEKDHNFTEESQCAF